MWDENGTLNATLFELATRSVDDAHWSAVLHHFERIARAGHRAVWIAFGYNPHCRAWMVSFDRLQLVAPKDLTERCRLEGIQVERASPYDFVLRWAPPLCRERCVARFGELGCGGAGKSLTRCRVCGRHVSATCNASTDDVCHPVCAEQ
jgi:hypothetical protein